MQDGLHILLASQQLTLYRGGKAVSGWPISSAAAGAGEREGSGCTPRGWHRVRVAIGDGLPINSVLLGRRATGEVYSEALARQYPERDWILTRILWLTGAEPGFNRGGRVDTLRRFIYIHGTPDSEPMGEPRSHGCIRMHNAALIALFKHCHPGMPVLIEESE